VQYVGVREHVDDDMRMWRWLLLGDFVPRKMLAWMRKVLSWAFLHKNKLIVPCAVIRWQQLLFPASWDLHRMARLVGAAEGSATWQGGHLCCMLV
jgi:hypothetical protein